MDGLFPKLIPSISQDGPTWTEHPFLARLTAVYTLTNTDVGPTGLYQGYIAGTNLYSFIEQTSDPQTGLPVDVKTGRRTIPPPPYGDAPYGVPPYYPISAYALEVNNSLVTIQTTPQAPFANPGPWVEMRLRALVRGSPVYEFVFPELPLAILHVTGSMPATIYLGRSANDGILVAGINVIRSASINFTSGDVNAQLVGNGIPSGTTITDVLSSGEATMSNDATSGGTGITFAVVVNTVQGYTAVTSEWFTFPFGSPTPAGVSDTQNVAWYYDINQLAIPGLFTGYRYACVSLASDAYNVPIYGGGHFFGASGTDGIGNVFGYGTNINIGGTGAGGGGTTGTISGGSDWPP